MDVLNAIIVGCGEIAGGYDEASKSDLVLSHAGAYRCHPGFRIIACVEPDRRRREAFMNYWDIPAGYDDLESCLANDPSPDVVSVCTPTATHGAILERLLSTPTRAVFCEKPMTEEFAEAERLARAYAESGKPLCVNYLRRWDPEMATLRDEIADGQWGEVRSATGFYAKGLRHTGAHMIDLLQFLLGPLSAERVLRRHVDYAENDPTADAVLSTADGAPVYLIGSDAADYARFEVCIASRDGVIEIVDSGFRIRRRPVGNHRHFPGRSHLEEGIAKDTGLGMALARAVENLHAAVTSGATLASDGTSALAAETLCDRLACMPVCGEPQ